MPGGFRLLVTGRNRPLRFFAVDASYLEVSASEGGSPKRKGRQRREARLLGAFADGACVQTGPAAGAGEEGPFFHERRDPGISLIFDFSLRSSRQRDPKPSSDFGRMFNELNGIRPFPTSP